MMKVKDLMSRATLLYNDNEFVRCSKKQYLGFLDDAIAQTVAVRPDAHVKTSEVTLIPGTRQTIPQDGYSLIDIYANINTLEDGTKKLGRPVFQVGRKDLDYYRNWHLDPTSTGSITEFAYDIRSPKVFFVWPPVGATPPVTVQMDYSYEIPQFADMPDEYPVVLEMDIPMDTTFRVAILDYMLYLLYSTDSTSDNDRSVANKYYQSFYQSLSKDLTSSAAVMPFIDDGKMQETGAIPYATTSTAQ